MSVAIVQVKAQGMSNSLYVLLQCASTVPVAVLPISAQARPVLLRNPQPMQMSSFVRARIPVAPDRAPLLQLLRHGHDAFGACMRKSHEEVSPEMTGKRNEQFVLQMNAFR